MLTNATLKASTAPPETEAPRLDICQVAHRLAPGLAERAAEIDQNDRFVTENYGLLKEAGLVQAGVPSEGPLQLGYPGQASLYFNDPSGNLLEVTCDGYTQDIPIRPPRLDGLAY